VLLIGGGYAGARSLGAFGSARSAPIYTERVANWIHLQQSWLWIAVAVVAIMVAVLALRWLIVQLRTERLAQIALDADGGIDPGNGAGPTDLPSAALTAAVGQEIDGYPGVRAVKVHMAGKPDQPELRVEVTIDPGVDPARIRARIADEALTHVRTALDSPRLPTQILFAVARPPRSVRTYL
jgi:hypothetical protein